MESKPHINMTNQELLDEKYIYEWELERYHPASKRAAEIRQKIGRVGYEIATRIEDGTMSPYTGTESKQPVGD